MINEEPVKDRLVLDQENWVETLSANQPLPLKEMVNFLKIDLGIDEQELMVKMPDLFLENPLNSDEILMGFTPGEKVENGIPFIHLRSVSDNGLHKISYLLYHNGTKIMPAESTDGAHSIITLPTPTDIPTDVDVGKKKFRDKLRELVPGFLRRGKNGPEKRA